MSSSLPPRRLIPRWRRVGATLSMAEGLPQNTALTSAVTADREELERVISEWRAERSPGHLGAVLAFSVATDCIDRVLDVAKEAQASGNLITTAQASLISTLLGTPGGSADQSGLAQYSICNPFVQSHVREVRSLLKVNPSNSLVLLDFAQLQLAAGQFKRAERSLRSALSLSPSSRLVLRTLARFYVHTGHADKAHALLARHPATPYDPWLMAGEVAVSQAAMTAPRFAKKGAKIALEKRKSYAHFTELAGAVAGLEMVHGNWKRARDLFRLALISPNDNVIAQAITDQRQLSLDLNAPEQQRVALGASEARTLLSWQRLDVEDAERDAHRWHAEEPFSSRPLRFLTTLCSVQGEYENAVALAKRGLVADPDDVHLTANLSFALASLGRLEEAERAASKARILDLSEISPQTTATLGLIAMKRGDLESADGFYQTAIDEFSGVSRWDMVAVCYAYYARAAFVQSHPNAHEILLEAVKRYGDAPSVDAALILRQLQQEVEAPIEGEPTRRLSQWVYDKNTNSLVRRDGITPVGAPPIVFRDGSSDR